MTRFPALPPLLSAAELQAALGRPDLKTQMPWPISLDRHLPSSFFAAADLDANVEFVIHSVCPKSFRRAAEAHVVEFNRTGPDTSWQPTL